MPQNDWEAVRWYRLSAGQGFALAQFNLGLMYARGEGVLKDSALAHMWLNIADYNAVGQIKGDFQRSRLFLADLERDMTRAEISRSTELARECMASDYQDCGR